MPSEIGELLHDGMFYARFLPINTWIVERLTYKFHHLIKREIF
jgi:hypothetical protein